MAIATKVPFAKPSLSTSQLLTKLKQQGLVVASDDIALRYISMIGHYRLKGYWFQLQNPITKTFLAGVTFENIVERYECDREIRAIILEAIERLEVAIRTTICNHLSADHTPHWYLNPTIFKPSQSFGIGAMLSKIEREVGRSRDKENIENYYKKYDDPYLPPSWAMSECVTLGMWSQTYSILRNSSDRKQIAAKFRITNEDVFANWLHTLSVLRNMAAHHDRFLNNKLRVSPQNYKAKDIKFSDNKSVYAAFTMIHVLLESINFNTSFRQRVINLQANYGMGMLQILGFPKNWPTGAKGW